ncbi:MAG: hypothetical protein K2R98_13285 [Gemmataceae bacterium]|nr:hypothetical protein [Gemmataceae bacterium]
MRETSKICRYGVDNLTLEEIEQELIAGGCFVFYEYCISFVFFTLRRPTEIFFLRASDTGLLRGLPYCLISFFLGWWGVPWGVIYTPLTIFTNLSGGQDVTPEVWTLLQSSENDT